ncbi:MAG: LysR family transcriptional regulator [Aliivibrio sp.]|uniref:LysR family transcriptional regulator n=1 Tax=Aliivibrio sp. TaxID=1872443 RepID=UPI001A4EFE07|nr:LysR family transcriptional regulator [Aliivibrio sp.]
MNLRHLTYFVTAATTGNITRAAEQLSIAQPALSMAIKKLEQELDLELFERIDKRIFLTSEGEVFLQHCKLILQQVEDAQIATAELKGLKKGTVTIGIPSMLGSYFFPKILMSFKRRYPEIKLIVIEAGTQSIRDMLVKGDLDIGVIINDNVPDQLHIEPLITAKMVAVTSIDHPLATLTSITFKQFLSHELIMFRKGYFNREFIDNISQKSNISPNISFETNLLPLILNIVRTGSAITSLLEIVTKEEPQLAAIPFKPTVALDVVMARRKNGYLSIAEKAFYQHVKQETDCHQVL